MITSGITQDVMRQPGIMQESTLDDENVVDRSVPDKARVAHLEAVHGVPMGYDVVTVSGAWCSQARRCAVAQVAQADGWVRERGFRVRRAVSPHAMALPPIASLRLPEHLARFVQEQAERQFRSRNSWLTELIAREYAAANARKEQAE